MSNFLNVQVCILFLVPTAWCGWYAYLQSLQTSPYCGITLAWLTDLGASSASSSNWACLICFIAWISFSLFGLENFSYNWAVSWILLCSAPIGKYVHCLLQGLILLLTVNCFSLKKLASFIDAWVSMASIPNSYSLGYIHTLSQESPDCCHHIKLEIGAIGLPSKPDMLSFAESTTALTSFFCFLPFSPSCHSILKKFLLKAMLVINSLSNPVNITDISVRKSAALWKIWLTFKSCEIFGQQDSSPRYVLVIRITQYAGAWKFYLNL